MTQEKPKEEQIQSFEKIPGAIDCPHCGRAYRVVPFIKLGPVETPRFCAFCGGAL